MKARKSILVVDDEPCVRDICAQFLSMSGYEVSTSCSGEEALEAVARRPFDLLILDLAMQGMDGLTTLLHLKAIAPETKAVVVSGSLDRFESELRHAQRNGLAGILAKPFALQDLSSLVESAFASRRRAA
jgi:DNA-binding NtrC family response regulator